MKHLDKKEILGTVTLSSSLFIMRIVAVETAQKTFTAYLSPAHKITLPEKPTKAQVAKFERQHHHNDIAVANRGIILEKEVAMSFFPKLKKRKYAKKVLNPEFQK